MIDPKEIHHRRWYCYKAKSSLTGKMLVRRGRCVITFRIDQHFAITGVLPGRLLYVHERDILCEARPPFWRPVQLIRFRKRKKQDGQT